MLRVRPFSIICVDMYSVLAALSIHEQSFVSDCVGNEISLYEYILNIYIFMPKWS